MPKAKAPSRSESAIKDCILAYRKESLDSRRNRERLVRDNWAAIHGEHDWSHKQKHQSKEWLPESAMALEQIGAFMKRSLVDFGEWYDAKPIGVGETPIPSEAAEELIGEALNSVDFPTIVSDAIKLASIESLATAKIHGRIVTDRRFYAERGVRFVEVNGDGGEIRIERVVEPKVKTEEVRRWQLAIDLVPFEAYFPDPRGRKLYEIHRVERDLHELREMEEGGVYDPAVIELIVEDFERAEDEAAKLARTAQTKTQPPAFRKRVVIDECWGTLLSKTGRVMETNIVSALANEKYVIRPPEDNPFWHGESCFVSEPLIRIPLSVWHKAILDHAVPLNRVMSEILNLIIDGGFRGVWGLGQVRPDIMENPEEITDGIPQGFSAVLKSGVPIGQKWYERVDTTGSVAEGLPVFQALSQAHQKATAVPDIKIGGLPQKQVLATEISQVVESTSTIFEGIARDFEDRWIEKVLDKTWKTQWQHLDDFSPDELLGILGPRDALLLQRMLPEERFAMMAKAWRWRVFGIRAVLSRARDFQKLATFLELLGNNRALAEAFQQEYSIGKLLLNVIKTIDIDPEGLKRDPNEPVVLPAEPGRGGTNGKVAMPNPGNIPAAVPLPEEIFGGRRVS